MLFTEMFDISLLFIVFAVFFLIGYFSEKRSGGFLLIFSGFAFLAFDALSAGVFGVVVSALMSPFAIFIILLGIMKAFYQKEQQQSIKGD